MQEQKQTCMKAMYALAQHTIPLNHTFCSTFDLDGADGNARVQCVSIACRVGQRSGLNTSFPQCCFNDCTDPPPLSGMASKCNFQQRDRFPIIQQLTVH